LEPQPNMLVLEREKMAAEASSDKLYSAPVRGGPGEKTNVRRPQAGWKLGRAWGQGRLGLLRKTGH